MVNNERGQAGLLPLIGSIGLVVIVIGIIGIAGGATTGGMTAALYGAVIVAFAFGMAAVMDWLAPNPQPVDEQGENE